MSDVLLQNAISENQRLLKKYAQSLTGAVTDISYYADPNIGVTYNDFTRESSSTCPQMVKDWKKVLTPFTKPKTNGFKVCDTSGNFRCGSSCSWTVPAGVTNVQFQLWGPGGGNSGMCCCGGTPFGPTGSYAVANVPVTPGETFTLTSGCAFCCYATQTTPGLSGTSTTVVASNATFCLVAPAAVSNVDCWKLLWSGINSGTTQLPANDGCAPDYCSGWNWCWDNASDNTSIPYAFSKNITWSVPANTRNATVYGLPAIYPIMVIGPDATSSYTQSAPVFGFENCTCRISWGSFVTNGIGNCYYQAVNGYQQIPAVGGYGGFVQAGNGAIAGDAGGMGMICVSYD